MCSPLNQHLINRHIVHNVFDTCINAQMKCENEFSCELLNSLPKYVSSVADPEIFK